MADIKFTKMHGLGNDYVYIDCMKSVPDDLASLAVEMSDRHTGVGGDGIILILPSETADCRMRMFNADGSEGKMCGNGIRCVGKFVYDNAICRSRRLRVETLAGVKTLDLVTGSDGMVAEATVDMGEPVRTPSEIPVRYDGETMTDAPVSTQTAGEVRLTAVSMGNPHGVIFFDRLADADVHRLGRELETASMWPDRANIEMAEINSPHEVTMRVWERGSGETMACGTGACATAVAAVATGRAEWPVRVNLPGGSLDIDLNGEGHVMMTGPATTVFTGTYRRS